MEYQKITESDSYYHNLELKSSLELLQMMNHEDQKVALAVQECIPVISELVDKLVLKMKEGGRLFYIGAGTSGRLGILDASECPPTFGVSPDLVVGLIAGGDSAIRKAVEGAEDSPTNAWLDLKQYAVDERDIVLGIAASGTTTYVVQGLHSCKLAGITTACITCNPDSPITKVADYKIVCVVGPEFITGSTRLKSGTAQKLILNMISSTTMIRLGHVLDNKMIDMTLSNSKLFQRGIHQILGMFQINREYAEELLNEKKSVRAVIDYLSASANS